MKNKTLLILASAFGSTLFSGCTTNEMLRLALDKDPQKALEKMANKRIEAYRYDPELAIKDFNRVKSEFDKLMGKLQKDSGEKWGKNESEVLPGKKRYVKYTDDYKNRTVVDYDKGTILIEHLDEAEVKGKLKRAVVVALLTPDDPGAVDLFSDKEVELKGKPYLQQLVVDQNNNPLNTREEVERYADYLVGNRLQSRQIEVDGSRKNVAYVNFSMVNSHIDKRALKYATTVRKYSDETQVSRSLIYAIIKIESAFNPYAVSSAPAYGMMQLVPSSGGREAYRKAKGKDESPSKEYLFDADNNIELGSTYLSVLLNDSPLKHIENPLSREYCAIAAYNTGPSNMFKAFSSNPSKTRQADAIDKINAMRPDEVYENLRLNLPYTETRGYIVNAVAAKKMYIAM